MLIHQKQIACFFLTLPLVVKGHTKLNMFLVFGEQIQELMQ
jgi:hypothetical protein